MNGQVQSLVETSGAVKVDAVLSPREGGVPANVLELREALLKKYYKGEIGIAAKLRAEGKEDSESLVVAIIDELVKESDQLLGNALVALANGELQGATVISVKRSEALERAFNAIQKKRECDSASGVNIDSPFMVEVFRFFMTKVNEALTIMRVKDEMRDVFFRTLSSITENWKRDLRDRLAAATGSPG